MECVASMQNHTIVIAHTNIMVKTVNVSSYER